jgi:hypothetical protein
VKHIHFIIHRLRSTIIIIYSLLFFSDCFLPISRLIIPNPHRNFKLKGRNIIFECDYWNPRSIILKEGISNGILKVFVLFSDINFYDFFIYVFCSTLALVKNHTHEWNTLTLSFIDWRVLLLSIVIILFRWFPSIV